MHMAGNMIFLWVFGNAVCAKVGSPMYVPIYLALGAIAGIAHLLFESADLARPARAILDAEQLFLDALGHHRGRIEHNEWPVGAMGLRVQHARRKFLAGSRCAADQHAAVRRRHLLDLITELIHSRRAPDHFSAHNRPLLQVLHLAAQAVGLSPVD